MADKKKRPDAGKGAAKKSSKKTEVAPVEPKKTTALQKVVSPAPITVPEGKTADEKEEPGFLVVGVGASAGGLDALGELFRNIRADDMSFIVVQHLSPDHESILSQLLARSARMPVVSATDGAVLRHNQVYVIPPNADLAVMHGVIRILTPSGAYGPRLPVDYTFRSIAQDFGSAAVGVVLSGTGTDGTLGLKAIKAAGGYTFAQDPATAKYDGMPRSALASGAVDLCLSSKEIADELSRIAHRRAAPTVDRAIAVPQVQDQLSKLFVLIRAEFGNDLSQYKQSTIDRRIERRMILHKIGRLDEYVRYVQQHRDELTALYKDMLITVTSFFRDPETFEALKTEVFPRLLEERDPGHPIRIWVPACATGEEAYSIAMSLVEYCEDKGRDERIQIFGTDVDDEAIQTARRGAYPANIALDVSTERLNRFFIKRDDAYVVARDLRNPLGAILMESSFLQLPQEKVEHGRHEVAEAIARSANRMKRLIRDLLDVSRMETKPLAVEPTPISVSTMMPKFAKSQEPAASAQGLELRLDVAPGVGDAFADHDRLIQALENLVTNAVKHTKAGGTITIGAKRENNDVLFWVADTGSGIAPDALPHLFERFSEGRLIDRYGTGLGLPIVKGIVDAHGGRVWVESTLGAGSTFFFTLPSASASTEKRVVARQKASA